MSPSLDLGCGPPLLDRDQARFEWLQTVEEAHDLGVAAMALGFAGETVVPSGCLGHLLGFDVRRHLRQRQVAPGGNRRHQLPDDPVWVVLVTDQVHDGDQHDRDRAGEVQGARRLRQDLLRVAQVGVDVVQGPPAGNW